MTITLKKLFAFFKRWMRVVCASGEKPVFDTETLHRLFVIHTTPSALRCDNPLSCIVFSMNRASQLHALLSSYREMVTNHIPITVLYRYTSGEHERAYCDVASLHDHQDVSFLLQRGKDDFKSLLLHALRSCGEKVFFLVDDIVFIEKTDMRDFAKYESSEFIASLRLGRNVVFSYVTNQTQQLPHFVDGVVEDGDKLCWRWKDGAIDWGYPLSVDGTLYLTRELLFLTEQIDFFTPNTYEANMQRYYQYFMHRYGICYNKSKIMNIPMNRVQSDYDNLHENIHEDYLLHKWNEGFQIDYRKFYGYPNNSAHQVVPISFMPR